LSELLSTQRSNTIEHVQLKQSRTVDEREEDEEEVVEDASEDDDDDEEVVYNPKNLPLGWDGKVIINTRIRYVFLKNTLSIIFF
jgi:splicing factor 3A subunit 3